MLIATDQYEIKFQNEIKCRPYLPTLIFLAMSPETEHLFFLALVENTNLIIIMSKVNPLEYQGT